jgi:hypothetical protein
LDSDGNGTTALLRPSQTSQGQHAYKQPTFHHDSSYFLYGNVAIYGRVARVGSVSRVPPEHQLGLLHPPDPKKALPIRFFRHRSQVDNNTKTRGLANGIIAPQCSNYRGLPAARSKNKPVEPFS